MRNPELRSVPGLVDRCEFISPTEILPGRSGNLSGFVAASGWIFAEGASLEQVWVVVDGQRCAPAKVGYSRPDVAAELGQAAAISSGFRALLSTNGFSAGDHVLTVETLTCDGELLSASGPPYILTLATDATGASLGLGHIDEIRVDDELVDASLPIEISGGSIVTLRGWALLPDLKGGTAAFLRGRIPIPLSYGLERSDVATVHGEPARFSGFVGAFPADMLHEQRAVLQLSVIDRHGTQLRACNPTIELVVVRSGAQA